MSDLIEEVRLEHGVCLQNLLFLLISLHVSEVRVEAKREGTVARKTTEGNIALNLVCLSQSERAVRADLAVILNGHDSVKETVLLDERAVDLALVWVLRRCVLENVTLLLFLFLGLSCSGIWVSFTVLLDVDEVAVSCESAGQLVVLSLVL